MKTYGENGLIEKIIYNIGVSAPYFIFIFSLYILRLKNNYLSIYCIGYVINIILNILLKFIIKEPRPLQDKMLYNIFNELDKHVPFNSYGMPSGHAQLTAYTLTYLYLVTKSMSVLCFTLFLISITIFQRVLSKKHSIKQVLVGTIIGIGLGYFFYKYANKLIRDRV